jgi:hypothetical protein
MQRISRFFLAPVVMLFAMLAFAVPASAADGWLPAHFDAHQHVYVDPALANDSQYPVNVDGLEAQLDNLSQQEGIELIFVLSKKGTGTIPPQYNGKYATWQLDDLINRWSSQPGFKPARAEVIMLVRSDRNPNAFAWAVNPGTDVRANGVTSDFLTDSYLTNLRNQYLPNDIKGWVLQIANDSNGKWHATVAHRAFMAALPMYIGIGAVLALLIGAFLFFLFRYLAASKRLAAELAKWAPKMDSVTQLYMQLNDPAKGYLDFFTDQKGRRESFRGKTKEKYEAALADYSRFVVRRQLAADLYEGAKKAYDGRKFIASTGALNAAADSLTVTKVVITGQEKNLRDITDVFGGLIEKSEYTPDQLLANINDTFRAVTSVMGGIMDAFTRASANKATISTTLGEVEAMEAKVTAAGLTFEPYRKREAGIQQEADTLLADISSDPVGKLADSNRINDGVVDLKGDIEHCLAIKAALPATIAATQTVRERIATIRGTATALAYPLIAGEKPGKEAGSTFFLNEEGGNPDSDIAEADAQAKACEDALQAGEWEQAQAAKEAAEAAAKAANALVDDVLAAKAYVEQHVPKARSAKENVAGKLSAARTAAQSLQTNFLAANIKGQPEKVETAQSVTNGTEGVIKTVRDDYYAQNFLAARKTLAVLETSIANADAGLAQVHARLAELEGLREHARKTAAEAVQKSSALKTKRTAKSFTTAAATDDAHKKLMPKVATLSANVSQDVADWPALAAEADQTVASLTALDSDVDTAERAYTTAKAKVEAVEEKVGQAATACNHSDVLQPAKDALSTARSELTRLQATLNTEKSDWAQLGRNADSKLTVADNAKQLAEQDKEDAKDARTAYAAAETLIDENSNSVVKRSKTGGYQNRSFSKSVALDLSGARSELAASEQCLRNKQWKEAKRHAKNVSGKIDDAETAAKREADRQVDQMIVIWIQQNPEPDPTPTSSGSSNTDFSIGTGNSFGGGDPGGSVGQSIGGQDQNF